MTNKETGLASSVISSPPDSENKNNKETLQPKKNRKNKEKSTAPIFTKCEKKENPVFAAIDLGTNNCRLLIARETYDGVRVIDAFSRIVRLGEGVRKTGVMSEAAMERTYDTLVICAEKMAQRGVSNYRAVATEACRSAANQDEFVNRIKENTGIDLEVINGAEEARLAFSGCIPLLDPLCTKALVFDIGGGSTEVIWLDMEDPSDPRVLDQVSVKEGVVSLTEHFGGDRLEDDVYFKIVDDIMKVLKPLDERNDISSYIKNDEVQIIGASGTVTTIAAVNFGLPRYNRNRVDGAYLLTEDAMKVSLELRRQDFTARAQHPCIGVSRADMVVAGCAILEAIYTLWPAEKMRIADRGVREGLLHELVRDFENYRDY